jgi:hypothetical protein
MEIITIIQNTLILALLAWIAATQIKRIDSIEGDCEDMKSNYIQRFVEIERMFNERLGPIIKDIATLLERSKKVD